jgi:hypothetical protein
MRNNYIPKIVRVYELISEASEHIVEALEYYDESGVKDVTVSRKIEAVAGTLQALADHLRVDAEREE